MNRLESGFYLFFRDDKHTDTFHVRGQSLQRYGEKKRTYQHKLCGLEIPLYLKVPYEESCLRISVIVKTHLHQSRNYAYVAEKEADFLFHFY